MRLRKGREAGSSPDTGWRITPFGAVLLVAMIGSFALGAITGGFVFYAIGTFLLCMAFAGYFASMPSPWRARGDEKGRTVDPLGNITPPPGDD